MFYVGPLGGLQPERAAEQPEFDSFLDQSLLQFPSLRLGTSHIAGYTIDAKLNASRMLCDSTQSVIPGLTNVDFESADAGASLEFSNVASAKDLMNAVYPILRDDRALRQLQSEDAEKLGDLFDALRRDYPPRREIAALTDAQIAELGEGAQRLARALRVQLSRFR